MRITDRTDVVRKNDSVSRERRQEMRKKLAGILALTLICGCVGVVRPSAEEADATATETTMQETDPTAAPAETPEVTPTPLQTLSPEALALKERVEEAEKKSRLMPQLGCYGSIGVAQPPAGSATIYLDSIDDGESGLIYEKEERRLDSDGSLIGEIEGWYDGIADIYYKYDPARKQYMYSPAYGGECGEVKSTYLSLDFYLDYTTKYGDYFLKDPVTIETRDGKTVTCDVIHAEHEVTGNFIPFDNVVKNTTEDIPIEDGRLDIPGSDPDETKKVIVLEYAIGSEDGLIYRIRHATTKSGADDGRVFELYYPNEKLSVPSKFTKNPILVEGITVKKNKARYLSYYKGNKTCFVASDYVSGNSKTLTLLSKIKLGKRSYTVTTIAWRAFSGMKCLKKVTIPKTITQINDEAFLGCGSLKTLVVKNKTLRKKLKKSKKERKNIGLNNKVKIKG